MSTRGGGGGLKQWQWAGRDTTSQGMRAPGVPIREGLGSVVCWACACAAHAACRDEACQEGGWFSPTATAGEEWRGVGARVVPPHDE
eukprot:scaffold43941_cov33-Tisochrysis_lutea.AAC.11